MKIKVIDKEYSSVLKLKKEKHKRPKKSSIFWRTLMKLVSVPDLKATNFKYTTEGMEKLKKGEAALFLMNHSSFIDLEILATVLYPRAYNIVTTTDAFMGKDWLMRQIGCMPTKKFVHDHYLIKDMTYALKELNCSVVLFPEAGYSFDGTATTVPETVSMLVKMLGVPLVMIRTYGAFARDPLYNNIQVREVDVSAKVEYLLSPEEISLMTREEINDVIQANFSFDNFKWQQENKVEIDEPTRADYLHRVLYKCPSCGKENKMLGKGTVIKCMECGKVHTLDEYGYLTCEGEADFTHIPDWYAWEREEVKKEVENGTYHMESPVEIFMSIDTKHLYRIGKGDIVHDMSGIHLNGCNGQLDYHHKPMASYSINADYNWYEIGDMICIGDHEKLFYCFPSSPEFSVSKARLATEEMYKTLRAKSRIKKEIDKP